jgi:hypothetical protein
MNLTKKYLDISIIKPNETFGLFNIKENKKHECNEQNKQKEQFVANNDWMFTENGLRKYDDNGNALYDNTGKQIYGIGSNGLRIDLPTDPKSVSNPFKKKKHDTNSKIDNSILNDSINKIFNNITNKVIQNNITQAASAAGAFNNIDISKIKCKNVIISGISQDASAVATTMSQSTQKAKSNITNKISTNIQSVLNNLKTNGISAYSDENNKSTMDVNNLFNINNDTAKAATIALDLGNAGLFDDNNKIDNSISSVLNINNSIKIQSENNISNIISNNVTQTNLATCVATAAAANNFKIQDIVCENSLTISNIQQKAFADAIAKCTFDQSAVSNITNSINTQIASSFNQVYDSTLDKLQTRFVPAESKQAYKEYYDSMNKIDALGRLYANGMLTASCATSDNTIDKTCLAALQAKAEERPPEQTVIVVTPYKPPQQQQPKNEPASSTNLWYTVGSICLFLLILLIILVLRRKSNNI